MAQGPRTETLIFHADCVDSTLIFQRGLRGFQERLTRIEQDILAKQVICSYPRQSVIIRGNPRKKTGITG